MPFRRKAGSDKFESPSGRTFSEKQVKLYYATDGFSRRSAKHAKPQAVLSRRRKPSL